MRGASARADSTALGGREFRPETVDNFELGYKSTWLENRLLFNAAIYRALSEDFQFFFVDINAGGAQVIDNLDEVTLTGFEAEFEVLVNNAWSVYASLGIQDSEIDEISPTLAVPAEVGNKTPKTTEHTFNVGTRIDVPIGSALDGFLLIDFERRGDKYWHPDNVDVMDAVNLLSARVGIGGRALDADGLGQQT